MDSNHLITSAHSIQSMRELQDLVEKIDYGLTADKMREVYNKHCNDLKYLLIIEKALDQRKKRKGYLSKGAAIFLTDVKDRISQIQNKNRLSINNQTDSFQDSNHTINANEHILDLNNKINFLESEIKKEKRKNEIHRSYSKDIEMEYEEQLESLKTKNSDLTTQINNLNSKVDSLQKSNKILENNLKEERNKEKEEYSDEIIDNYIKGLRRNIEYLKNKEIV